MEQYVNTYNKSSWSSSVSSMLIGVSREPDEREGSGAARSRDGPGRDARYPARRTSMSLLYGSGWEYSGSGSCPAMR